jgi:hypothetical protein
MVIKMMLGKKHISIEDVISEKQINFSRNLYHTVRTIRNMYCSL